MALGPGKPQKRLVLGEIRPLTREDLAEIMEPREATVVKRLRDPHHLVARLIAAGVRPMEEVARRSGFSLGRIYTLQSDPAFKELCASYRTEEAKAFFEARDDFYELATSNMMKGERMLAEKLDEYDEEGKLPSLRDLVTVVGDRADRFGYGKRTTNLNVNVDFAAKLEQAIARSGKVIDNVPLSPDEPRSLPVVARRA